MGVIQSAVNQAIGAAGETIRDVKLLEKTQELTEGQKIIGEGQKEVARNVLYTEEQKRKLRAAQLEQEEKEKLVSKIREQMQREREQQSFNDRQSTKSKIRNLKEQKERDILRKSVLGGDLNV